MCVCVYFVIVILKVTEIPGIRCLEQHTGSASLCSFRLLLLQVVRRLAVVGRQFDLLLGCAVLLILLFRVLRVLTLVILR